MNFGLLLLMGIIFYIFFIKPQSKQRKEAEIALGNLKKGDKIITSGGVHGRILQDNGSNFLVEIASNTKVKIEKVSISIEMTKTLTDKED